MTLVTHRCTSTPVCVATQTRDVVVYRLVTCGTVEEKIYRKQVFKGGLSRAGMEDGVQLRCVLWPPASLVINPEPCNLYIFYISSISNITVYHIYIYISMYIYPAAAKAISPY